MRDIVVVGGSIGGFTAASELRDAGFDGRIRIIGDEPVRTYRRPPLSKGVLAGDDADQTAWAAAQADDLDIGWLLGERATSLDLVAGSIGLRNDESIAFDGLVIASGATPRRLPDQPDLAGVHVVRSLDDSLGLRADHRPDFGAAVADLHRVEGVDLRLGVGVDALEGNDRVEAVRLGDGSSVAADVVVIGIGVVPNTDWLEGSGLPIDDGVVADSSCLVAPRIVACGDVARWDSPRYGSVRIEHWDHAVDMGCAAARRLLATDDDAIDFDPVPWFWSDQYDVRLQLAGRADGDMVIVDGSVDDGRFVALYGRDGMVTGALGWNWPAKTVRYRMALERGLRWADAVG